MADDKWESVLGTEELEPESNEWILTFADLVTLLLVFFILLYSMSTLDPKKFTDSFLSVKLALGMKDDALMTARVKSEEAAILDTVLLQKQLIEAQRKVFSDVRTFITRRGVEGVVAPCWRRARSPCACTATCSLPAAGWSEKRGRKCWDDQGFPGQGKRPADQHQGLHRRLRQSARTFQG